MQKINMLKQIEDARKDHTQWLLNAKNLIENMSVTSGMLPINFVECKFGKWFYSEGVKYKKISQIRDMLEKMDALHKEIHSIYINIYKIYFVSLKRSWLMSKILDNYKQPSLEQQKDAYDYYIKLENISILLMKEFDFFEQTLKNMDIKEIKGLL